MLKSIRRYQSTMTNLKFSANLSFMYQEYSNLLERYAQAKQSGFRAVECASVYEFPVEEIQKIKEKCGVDQALINMYPGPGDKGIIAIPGKEEEFRENLAKTITYAKALNCGLVHIISGVVKSPTLEHDEVFKKNLRYAVSTLEKENLIGVIEVINPYSVPNYYMNSYEKAMNAIKEINSPSLKLQLDIFHLQRLNGNLTHNIESFLPYIGHIQVAQVPGRHEPNSEGEINFNYVFNLLRKLKYSGWIGLEYIPATNTEESLRWLKNGEYEGLEPLYGH